MEKKLLPEDLFGPPSSGKKPVKPPAKTAGKGGKISTKAAASKPQAKKKVASARRAPPVKEPSPEPDRRKLIEQFKRARELEKKAQVGARKVKAPPKKADERKAKRKKREECPSCSSPVPENARVCPHCYASIIECPYCGRRAGALENPKMVTEQRFNRILKQYTLFGLALPSMPIQAILDCSECKSRVIICESCQSALKYTARSCPACGNEVRQTKLLINPITILESIIRRPEALRGIQRLIDLLLGQSSKE
jgi:hypothetical protein